MKKYKQNRSKKGTWYAICKDCEKRFPRKSKGSKFCKECKRNRHSQVRMKKIRDAHGFP